LSKAGIQYGSSAQWGSIYGNDFKDKRVDLTANHAMAQAVGAMFNGAWVAAGRQHAEDGDFVSVGWLSCSWLVLMLLCSACAVENATAVPSS
jgi:hypothetical protein